MYLQQNHKPHQYSTIQVPVRVPKGLSTTAQLLQVLHKIGQSLDNRTQTDAVFLNLAKAFDRVDHQLLLFKLQRFGITGKLLDWFTDYLSNRFQRVTVLGVTSEPLPVLSGAPQGSILGPLLLPGRCSYHVICCIVC